MKLFKYISLIALLLSTVISCKKEDFSDISFVSTAAAPSKLSAMFDITQDNTGLVTILPNGEGAVLYDIYFGDTAKNPVSILPLASAKHIYAEGVYQVKIVGHDIKGGTTTATQQLTVSFRAPENLQVNAAVDAINNFRVNVSASALYETVFKIYWGDVANEVPQSFLEGATISHIYAAVGTYAIKVVALSGGAATTQLTQTITITDPVILPLDFQSTSINYAWGDFAGGAVTVINNPQVNGINTSTKVAKMIKSAGQVYGGSTLLIGSPIDFSTNKVFRMKVFSPRVGARVLLKIQNGTNANIFYQQETPTTVANAWEDLVFDFNGVDVSQSYQLLVVIFDNGTMGDGSANFTFLFDDIRQTNQIPTAILTLPITFDVAGINYAVTDFGGNVSVNSVDPTNAANKVKKSTKPVGAATYAGATIGTYFSSAIPFTATVTQMSVRVYSPAAGIHVRLKVEDHTNSGKSVETEAITNTANTWETLIFDFSAQAAGTAALNLSYNYDMASIFFDFNNAGTGKVFYYDDIKFLPVNVIPNAVVLPLDFESTTLNYVFSDFAGGNSVIINNPQSSGINTSSKVVRMIKNAGQVYGGSLIQLANPINFSVKKTFTMKVFSPRIGAKVLLKVEEPNNAANNFQQEVATTKANAWETLTFDYSAINTGFSYQNVVIIFDNGTMGDGSANFTFLYDDISLN